MVDRRGTRYADGGYSGGSTERPTLQRLLADVRARKVDVIVVYKVDRLTRSLADFVKLVELFDGHGVSFVSAGSGLNALRLGRPGILGALLDAVVEGVRRLPETRPCRACRLRSQGPQG
jgi:DNA invertase Pin-like site-specific DNA recombinase